MISLSRNLFSILVVFTLIFSNSALAENAEIDVLSESNLKISITFASEDLREHEARIKLITDQAYSEFAELFDGPAKKLNGKPYDHLKIKVSRGFSFGADPETIELSIYEGKLFGISSWETALVHEVLHFWSAETFRYADGKENWFNEGVTEYLALRASAKLGLIPKEDIFNVFAKPIGTYLSAKGLGKLSLREAGSTDELKRQHYFLIYHGGYVAGMVLDHQIRLKSDNKKSLDDVMRAIYRSNSRAKTYDMAFLIESIAKTTGQNYQAFFDDYIDGKKIIPVGSYFDIGWLGAMLKVGGDVEALEQKVLLDMLTF